jgi:hypothetical protein
MKLSTSSVVMYMPAANKGNLKMEAIYSSETSALTRATRHDIPEDDILHSHRRENLKSYIALIGCTL